MSRDLLAHGQHRGPRKMATHVIVKLKLELVSVTDHLRLGRVRLGHSWRSHTRARLWARMEERGRLANLM